MMNYTLSFIVKIILKHMLIITIKIFIVLLAIIKMMMTVLNFQEEPTKKKAISFYIIFYDSDLAMKAEK
jgi:hypothetical protein